MYYLIGQKQKSNIPIENKIKIPCQKPTIERKRNGFLIEIDDKKPENNKMYKI